MSVEVTAQRTGPRTCRDQTTGSGAECVSARQNALDPNCSTPLHINSPAGP